MGGALTFCAVSVATRSDDAAIGDDEVEEEEEEEVEEEEEKEEEEEHANPTNARVLRLAQ